MNDYRPSTKKNTKDLADELVTSDDVSSNVSENSDDVFILFIN